jgi:hypothetical protein
MPQEAQCKGGRTLVRVIATLALFFPPLIGCARLDTVLRKADLNSGKTLITDAKQRVVTNVEVVPGSLLGRVQPTRVICAEPSPDVAQALSSSFSAAIQAAIQHPSGAQGQGSLQVANALSESIIELGQRLATVQLLRDKFYRACEAYANGAISATSYTLLLSRLDRTMTTLMLGEVAAGALTRSNAAASGTAASSTGMAVADVERASKSLAEARTDASTKQKARDDARAKLAKAQQTATNDPTDANKNAVTSATADLDRTQGELDAANRLVDGLEASLRERIASAAASSTGSPGKGALQVPSDKVAATLAQIHQQYLDTDDFGPLLDACVVSMDGVRRPDPVKLAQLEAARQELAEAQRDLTDVQKRSFTASRDRAAALGAARATFESKLTELSRAEDAAQLSAFGAACATSVLANLEKLLERYRSTQNFKAGLPLDSARLEVCKAAILSPDEGVRNAGIRCMNISVRDYKSKKPDADWLSDDRTQ